MPFLVKTQTETRGMTGSLAGAERLGLMCWRHGSHSRLVASNICKILQVPILRLQLPPLGARSCRAPLGHPRIVVDALHGLGAACRQAITGEGSGMMNLPR